MILVWVLSWWFSHFSERITPPARPLPGPLNPPLCKYFNISHRKKNLMKITQNFNLVWVLFLWFPHFFKRPLPAPLVAPQFIKLLISIVEKKNYENYLEFDYSIGTVLVIFSFFWTDNDLVCAPPPPSGMSPFFQRQNYAHTFVHNSKTIRSIFVEVWEIVTNNMTVSNLKNTIIKYCYFWSCGTGL